MKQKKRKFPQGVARFFNPQKSGTNAEYNKFGVMVRPGTKQLKKMRETSCIIAYQGCGRPAIKTTNKYGQPIYVPQR